MISSWTQAQADIGNILFKVISTQLSFLSFVVPFTIKSFSPIISPYHIDTLSGMKKIGNMS